jgi:hypothetical protein
MKHVDEIPPFLEMCRKTYSVDISSIDDIFLLPEENKSFLDARLGRWVYPFGIPQDSSSSST